MDFKLGQHEQAIVNLEREVRELRADVRQILTIVAEKRGERRMGLGVVGFVSTIVSGVVTAILTMFASK